MICFVQFKYLHFMIFLNVHVVQICILILCVCRIQHFLHNPTQYIDYQLDFSVKKRFGQIQRQLNIILLQLFQYNTFIVMKYECVQFGAPIRLVQLRPFFVTFNLKLDHPPNLISIHHPHLITHKLNVFYLLFFFFLR